MTEVKERDLYGEMFEVLNRASRLDGQRTEGSTKRSDQEIKIKAFGVPTDGNRTATVTCTMERSHLNAAPLCTAPEGWVAHDYINEWGPVLTDWLERLHDGALHRGFKVHGICQEHSHTTVTLWARWGEQLISLTWFLQHEE